MNENESNFKEAIQEVVKYWEKLTPELQALHIATFLATGVTLYNKLIKK